MIAVVEVCNPGSSATARVGAETSILTDRPAIAGEGTGGTFHRKGKPPLRVMVSWLTQDSGGSMVDGIECVNHESAIERGKFLLEHYPLRRYP